MGKSRLLKTSGYGLTAALFVAFAIVMAFGWLGGPTPLHAAKLWAVMLLVLAVWPAIAAVRAYRVKIDRTTIETFEKWADPKSPPPQEEMHAQGHVDHIRQQVKERPTTTGAVLSIEGLSIELQDVLSNANRSFGVVKIAGNSTTELNLHNATIWRLETQAVPKLSFTNCRIGQVFASA